MNLAMPRRHRLGLFGERQSRGLFVAQVTSYLGSAFSPIAYAFGVLELTGSPTDLGLVLAARTLPQVAFVLLGGALADRVPRRRVLVLSNVVSGAAQAAAALVLITSWGGVPALAVLAAVNGAAAACFLPALYGVVPELVPHDRLQGANAMMRLAYTGSISLGSAVGGLTVAAVGPGPALICDAFTYFASAVLLTRLATGGRHHTAAVHSFVHDLRAGWREFRQRTWLWSVVAQFAVVNALWK